MYTKAFLMYVQVAFTETSFCSLTFKAASCLKLVFNHYLLGSALVGSCHERFVGSCFRIRTKKKTRKACKLMAEIHALFSRRQNRRVLTPFFPLPKIFHG